MSATPPPVCDCCGANGDIAASYVAVYLADVDRCDLCSHRHQQLCAGCFAREMGRAPIVTPAPAGG